MKICFDMDGTIADFYNVPNWLTTLRAYSTEPYRAAAVLGNASQLARLLNKVRAKGYEIMIISWSSKESTPEFDLEVAAAKCEWLAKHFPSVRWNNIAVTPYGVDKFITAGSESDAILFDDNEMIRNAWGGKAYSPEQIVDILKSLVK